MYFNNIRQIFSTFFLLSVIISYSYCHKNHLVVESQKQNTDYNDGASFEIMTFKIRYKLFYPLFYSIIGSIVIGLSGILPLLVINSNTSDYLRSQAGKTSLNRWLSFAFGSILGDVFLHLLPETWEDNSYFDGQMKNVYIGLCVIIGFILFFIIEKLFIEQNVDIKENKKLDNNDIQRNGDCKKELIDESIKQVEIQAEGYLNLLANFIDNFTHGLAVGGSFLISCKIGVLTTICILIHEIPHEVSDFVILLRAGFNRWRAAKWQLLTATGSILGSLFALTADAATTGLSKAFILPMTSGAFLYIAMVSLLPPILAETNIRESINQLLLSGVGFGIMVLMSSHC